MRRTALLGLTCVALLSGCSDREPTALMPPGGPSFAKMNSNDFYQCQTGNPRGDCNWISGSLNKQHNVYFEDDVIPQKFRLDEAIGKTRVILEYGFRKGGSDAGGDLSGTYNGNYDFMASYDAGTGPNNPCVGDNRWGFACTAGALKAFNNTNFPGGTAEVTLPVGITDGLTPKEQVAYAAALERYGDARRKLLVLNATNLQVTSLTFSRSGDATTAQLVLEFTAPATASEVGVLFGMHFAYGGDWNTADGIWHGASGQSGSPFHTKIAEVRTNIQGNDYTTGKVLNNGAMAINVSGDVVLLPSLSLSKTAAATTVNAGDDVSYTITVLNDGLGAASNVVISDDLPGDAGLNWALDPAGEPTECSIAGDPGAQVLTCTFASLPPGTQSVTVRSPTTAATCPSISNTATATVNGQPVTGSPAGPVVIAVNCPDVSLTKEADDEVVNAGTQIGFTITVSNAGPGVAKDVDVTDQLPSGFTWSIDGVAPGWTLNGIQLDFGPADLAAGASSSVHVTAPTTPDDCGEHTNTAFAGVANGDDPDAAQASVTINCPSVALSKVAGSATVQVGGTISFEIEVENTGSGDATNVEVSDNLPSGLTWSIQGDANGFSLNGNALTFGPATLPAGESRKVTVVSSVTTTAQCGEITNTATASMDGGDVDGSPAEASVFVECPELLLDKTSSPSTYGKVGDVIDYEYLVTNTGNIPLAGPVTVDDDKVTVTCPNVNTVGNNDGFLDPDESITCTASYTITLADLENGSVKNTATATVDGVDSNDDDETVAVLPPVLTISKTPDEEGDDGYSVEPGDYARFTITVTNTGQGAALGVVITDALPSQVAPWVEDPDKAECAITGGVDLECNIPVLNPGASFSVTVKALVPNNILLVPPAPIKPPLEIDGNLVSDGGDDWATIGISCTSPFVGCRVDEPSGKNDNSFKGGTKEDTAVPEIVTGSIPPNKSDLLRFYVSHERIGEDVQLYLAWQRVQAPKGTTNMDFELNQSNVLSANGVTPVRTEGDILIKYDLDQGGITPTFGFHRWIESGNGQSAQQVCESSSSFPCWGKVQPLDAASALGAVNTAIVTDPIQPGPRSLDPFTFGEASINLHDAGIFEPGVCLNFGSAYLKSRSSSSFTSDVKDFIAPLGISVSNCEPVTLDNTAYVEADNHDKVSDTGEIEITSDEIALLDASAGGMLVQDVTAGSVLNGSALAMADRAGPDGSRRVPGPPVDDAAPAPAGVPAAALLFQRDDGRRTPGVRATAGLIDGGDPGGPGTDVLPSA